MEVREPAKVSTAHTVSTASQEDVCRWGMPSKRSERDPLTCSSLENFGSNERQIRGKKAFCHEFLMGKQIELKRLVLQWPHLTVHH